MGDARLGLEALLALRIALERGDDQCSNAIIEAFRGDAALSSWIYRITFNTAMSRLRTLKYRRPAEVPPETVFRTDLGDPGPSREVADWSDLADDRLLRSEMRTRLVSALSGLPHICRAAVLLRDVQGLLTEEASAVLGVKPQTLKSRLHRGRLILREQSPTGWRCVRPPEASETAPQPPRQWSGVSLCRQAHSRAALARGG